MSLATALEAAAGALEGDADAIRPANGDPERLLELLHDAGDGSTTRVLTWLLANEPEAGAELAEAWGAEARGSAAVLAIDEASLDKPARKVLRRLRHRLRSAGVAAPAEKTKRSVVASLPPVDDAFDASFLSAIDPSGGRMAYLVEANPGGGARLFETVVDAARGIVAFEVYTAPRKKARAFLDKIRAADRVPMLDVEASCVHAVIAHAETRQDPSRPPPRAFLEWRGRLVESGGKLPGTLAREALGDSPDGERTAHLRLVADLVRKGRIGPWPDPDRLREILDRVREMLEGPLIVSGTARQEQIERALAEASEEIYAEDGAAVAAHRLRESAFVFWKKGEEDEARACLAAACAFEAGAPADNPVAQALLDVPLGPAIEALLAESQEEGDAPSLVEPVGG